MAKNDFADFASSPHPEKPRRITRRNLIKGGALAATTGALGFLGLAGNRLISQGNSTDDQGEAAAALPSPSSTQVAEVSPPYPTETPIVPPTPLIFNTPTPDRPTPTPEIVNMDKAGVAKPIIENLRRFIDPAFQSLFATDQPSISSEQIDAINLRRLGPDPSSAINANYSSSEEKRYKSHPTYQGSINYGNQLPPVYMNSLRAIFTPDKTWSMLEYGGGMIFSDLPEIKESLEMVPSKYTKTNPWYKMPPEKLEQAAELGFHFTRQQHHEYSQYNPGEQGENDRFSISGTETDGIKVTFLLDRKGDWKLRLEKPTLPTKAFSK